MLWASGFPFVQIVPPPLEWGGGRESTQALRISQEAGGVGQCGDGEVDRFEGWYETISPSQALELSSGQWKSVALSFPSLWAPGLTIHLQMLGRGRGREGDTFVQPILKVGFNIPIPVLSLGCFYPIPSCVYPKEFI